MAVSRMPILPITSGRASDQIKEPDLFDSLLFPGVMHSTRAGKIVYSSYLFIPGQGAGN